MNAKVEGRDFSADTRVATTRLSNVVQENTEDIKVSGTQEVVDKAGRGSEVDYQVQVKAMKELARDIEKSLIAGTGNTGASGTARELTGIFAWITTNSYTSGGARDLTETLYNALAQDIWAQGVKPDTVYVNGRQKRRISGFTGGTGSSRYVEAESALLVNAVDTYHFEHNLGDVKPYQMLEPPKAFSYSDYGTIETVRVKIERMEQWAISRKDSTHGLLESLTEKEQSPFNATPSLMATYG